MANPAFIARNHLVEEAIRAGEDEGDLGPFFKLIERLSEPGQLQCVQRDIMQAHHWQDRKLHRLSAEPDRPTGRIMV